MTSHATVGPHACLILTSLLLAGCYVQNPDRSEPRYFEFVFPAEGNVAALPFQASDLTGRIVGVEVDDRTPPIPGLAEPFLAPLPGRPDALVVAWPGGTCDERADLNLELGGDRRPVFTLKLLPGPPECQVEKVPRRVVVLFDEVVVATSFRLEVVQ